MDERRATVLVCVLAPVLALGCAATEGDGLALTEMRSAGEFTGVRVSDGLSVEVTLATDNAGAIEVTSDANLVPIIVTDVVDGVLRVSADDIAPSVPTVVTVVMPTIASISVADEGALLTVADIARTGEGPEGELAINVSEGAAVEASGACRSLRAIVTGPSTLRGAGLECGTATIETLEDALVELRVTERAIVRAAGDGTIRLAGSPEVTATVTDDVTLEVE